MSAGAGSELLLWLSSNLCEPSWGEGAKTPMLSSYHACDQVGVLCEYCNSRLKCLKCLLQMYIYVCAWMSALSAYPGKEVQEERTADASPTHQTQMKTLSAASEPSFQSHNSAEISQTTQYWSFSPFSCENTRSCWPSFAEICLLYRIFLCILFLLCTCHTYQ